MDDRKVQVDREYESAEEVPNPAEATAKSPDTGGKKSALHGEQSRGVTGTATGTDASTPGRISMGPTDELARFIRFTNKSLVSKALFTRNVNNVG